MEATLLNRIIDASENLHGSGTLLPDVLEALARHLSGGPVRHSVETGSGASTLLFSHLSEDHTVFALETGGSVTNVKASALLNRKTTTFIEGPTQKTLPGYRFSEGLQVALLDGPHGFPFPNLEYYYIYPHIEENGLLVVDDIHIRSIHDLFNFLKADTMFELVEVVRMTAIFRRTAAPAFNPLADGWWLQGYNRRILSTVVWKGRLHRPVPALFRAALRKVRQNVKRT